MSSSGREGVKKKKLIEWNLMEMSMNFLSCFIFVWNDSELIKHKKMEFLIYDFFCTIHF